MGEGVRVEKGICSYFKEQFQIPDTDIRTYSPLALAYIGDGIFDLVIRSVIVAEGNTSANKLHKRTSQIVKAHTQAAMAEALLPYFSEEEKGIYLRGRNAKSPTMAKNATVSDYRRATGFEALLGWLYLSDHIERIVELTKHGLELVNIKI